MKRSVVTSLSKVVRAGALLLVLFVIVAIVALLTGPAGIGVVSVSKGLLCGWHEGFPALEPFEKTILFSIRLPRIIFAGIVGAALSTAGVVFQALLRNPLSDPYILGVSGGSAVGAITGIIIGAGCVPFGIPALAFLGAILTVVLVFVIGNREGCLDSNTLLLAGVIVNAFFSAVIMFFISISSNADLHNIAFWLMGDMSLADGNRIMLMAFLLAVGAGVVYCYARPLNLIVAGEETAMQLGVDVKRTKIVLFLAGSLMTAVAVSFAGIIGFVGLVIPHMMRMMLGTDHRLLLPASLLFGASFLVIADTIARVIFPGMELPVGVITALCGAPYFIYLLRTRSM
ncbi:MAG: iron chelate uptake ABC transporter family permease subunit [Thermodesulfobacteriota bacterium]|nr:iron chelate uptake ABC transporter family permease subunit [Thermodesulfobacteriota bacterium]